MQIKKKFLLTSINFEGQITFGYNDEGYLVYYLNESDQSEMQLRNFLALLPRVEEEFYKITNIPTVTVVKVPIDLSFDRFWEIQLKKINKLRCIPIYNKLKDKDRIDAIAQYVPYTVYCNKNSRGIVDPENYLKKEYFKNDWKKEK